jgi:putative intracellular protease/amidase
MTCIEIVVFDGVDELDAVAPFEILAAAGYQVELVTMEPSSAETGSHGMPLCTEPSAGRISSLSRAVGVQRRLPPARGARCSAASSPRPSPTGMRKALASPVSAPARC